MEIEKYNNKIFRKMFLSEMDRDCKALFSIEKRIGFITLSHYGFDFYFYGENINYSIKYLFNSKELDLSDFYDKSLQEDIETIRSLGGVPGKQLLEKIETLNKVKLNLSDSLLENVKKFGDKFSFLVEPQYSLLFSILLNLHVAFENEDKDLSYLKLKRNKNDDLEILNLDINYESD